MRLSWTAMRDSKNRYGIRSRYESASIGLVVLVFCVTLVGSCDEVERHKVLDYFFDGVPPLGQNPLESGLYDPNTQPYDQTSQTPTWYVHEPTKKCTNCHPSRTSGKFSIKTYLNAPAPKLCYNCHDDFTATASFVHGPVAVGQCLFCHNPHRTQVEHLLNKPEPELCYLCHDVSMIELIPAHLPGQTSACTECHNPHVDSTKALLKGAPIEPQSNREETVHEPPREPVMTAEQHEQLSRRQREVAELYYRSMELYQKGEWARARDGFVKVLENGLIPAPMVDTLRAHIADIDNRLAWAQNRQKNQP